MAARWLTEVDLPPDVFAVVMATGIVSLAGQSNSYPRISGPLAVLATVAFAGLAAGLVIRVAARPRSALGELNDPDVAFALFTFVAACAVLAARWDDHRLVVWLAGSAALAAWLVLAPVAVRDVLTRPRAELRDHAHGTWLLASVATSGLAITASDLATRRTAGPLLALATGAALVGLASYLLVTWLIVWRALSGPFVPEEVTPDSWILMGALAIAALAGARLNAAAHVLSRSGYQSIARPLALGAWIAAALWIPALLYAELWRVDHRPGSLHFTRVWWAAVFPLGMFSAASAAVGDQLHLHSLRTVSLVFFWVAVTVWLLVAVGLVHLAVSRVRAAIR